jgi:hypothetical protein
VGRDVNDRADADVVYGARYLYSASRFKCEQVLFNGNPENSWTKRPQHTHASVG